MNLWMETKNVNPMHIQHATTHFVMKKYPFKFIMSLMEKYLQDLWSI